MEETAPVLLVSCHPHKESFCMGIAQAVADNGGLSPVIHKDLYKENFPPVLPMDEIRRRQSFDPLVSEHAELLRRCRGLIIVHPDWWGMPPALLKGWIDRVLGPGTAYDFVGPEFGEKEPEGRLKGLPVLIAVTGDDPEEPLLRSIWIDRVFRFCGTDKAELLYFGNIRESSLNDREAWLKQVLSRAEALF